MKSINYYELANDPDSPSALAFRLPNGPLVTESVQHIKKNSLPLMKQRYRSLNSVNNVLKLNC
jgi:hypothetical protein